MTETQINEKLIEDVTRIMTVDEFLNGIAGDPWQQKIHLVEGMLNSGREDELITVIENILTKHDEEDFIGQILDKTYLTNTCTLLRYRQEQPDNPIVVYHEHNKLTAAGWKEVKEILDQYGETVVDCLELEQAGSIKALEGLLKSRFNEAVTAEIWFRDNPDVYRQKMPYLGHKIWACTQMLPIIKIRKKE